DSRVLGGGDPETAAPDPPFDAGLPRAAHGVPDPERDAEREHDPEQVEPVDRAHEPVLVEVAAVLPALLHPEVAEHPSDVSVDEPSERPPCTAAVAHVRRLRVDRLCRERMVLAMM